MANNGGTVITDKTKLKVFSMEGSAAQMQVALRDAIANSDVIISASVTGRRLTVVWYDVA
jgi:hypothetical protein